MPKTLLRIFSFTILLIPVGLEAQQAEPVPAFHDPAGTLIFPQMVSGWVGDFVFDAKLRISNRNASLPFRGNLVLIPQDDSLKGDCAIEVEGIGDGGLFGPIAQSWVTTVLGDSEVFRWASRRLNSSLLAWVIPSVW